VTHKKERLYRLKPLEWKGSKPRLDDSDKDAPMWVGGYTAATPFGTYQVYRSVESGEFRWGYCFDEYYDEDSFACKSVEDGKTKAEQHWRERIASMIEEVRP